MNPITPWVAQNFIPVLDSYIRPTDIGFEYGSGNSTIWLAQRVKDLTSVEHDKRWHEIVSGRLRERSISNVEYIICSDKEGTGRHDDDRGANTQYAGILEGKPADSLDFVFVDGIYRSYCSMIAINKVRSGGCVIVDDCGSYLPAPSGAVNPRTYRNDPSSPLWAAFWNEVSDWRRIWMDNGVKAAVMFLKP